jgi:hypothetical protein
MYILEVSLYAYISVLSWPISLSLHDSAMYADTVLVHGVNALIQQDDNIQYFWGLFNNCRG